MNRSDKVANVEQLNQGFGSTPHIIVTSFRGLTVNQSTELRRKVRAAGGSYRVIKNRLAKLAAKGTPVESLAGRLSGPCAVASHEDDPVALAKTLAEFAKDNPQIEVIAGVIDGKDILDEQGVTALSKLPGLQELRAQLLALFMTPATQLVRLLQTPGEQIARVLDARREQLEKEA